MDNRDSIPLSVVDLDMLEDSFVRTVFMHIHDKLFSYYSSVLNSEAKSLLPAALRGDVSATRRVLSMCQSFLQRQDGQTRDRGDIDLKMQRPVSSVASSSTKIVPAASAPSTAPARPSAASSSTSLAAAAFQTPLVSSAAQLTAAPSDDDDNVSSDSEVVVSHRAAHRAALSTEPADAATLQAAIQASAASAAAFLEAPPTSHPALPSHVRAAVDEELNNLGVLTFRETDAVPLSSRAEGVVKAFGEAFKAPSARGVTGQAVAKQEGALFGRATDATKMLALLMAARVSARDQLFGAMSQQMSVAYMDALVELLVKEINGVNFSRAQLVLAGAPAARELFLATASAASDGRQHITFSPVYTQLEAASSTAKLWSASMPRVTSESTSTSAAAAKPAAAATPAKKPRNRKKKNNTNNSSTKATNSTDAKPAATPAKSPAKDKQ